MRKYLLAFALLAVSAAIFTQVAAKEQSPELAIGKPVPDFKLEDQNGKPVSLADYKGKIVVLGEAAMMTAQLGGPNKLKFGMNREGNDNKQLALNIMHWLSGLLK